MLPENLDRLIQEILDAMNAQNPDAVAALGDPEMEFHSALASVVEGRVYRGRDGLADYFRDIGDAFGEVRWGPFEIVRRTGDDVVLLLRATVRGRGSGVPLEQASPQVWSFRDGKPWRNIVYPSLAEALEALGLSE
jgi:ketosteroid isomerase-like protein